MQQSYYSSGDGAGRTRYHRFPPIFSRLTLAPASSLREALQRIRQRLEGRDLNFRTIMELREDI